MKVLGIVGEYNPMHNGHVLHLNKTKEIAHPDYTIAVMSGNFTQRGKPALMDKWSRANLAISQGIDMVLELPIVYSISSAEDFAKGAMNIFKETGVVNFLSFGSECGDINKLEALADLFLNEPSEFKEILNMELSKGLSYPKALSNATMQYFAKGNEFAKILDSPNNTLGIEYIKALKEIGLKATVLTIGRNSDYLDESGEITNGIASATSIRKLIYENQKFHTAVPFETFEKVMEKKKENKLVYSLKEYEKIIMYIARSKTKEELQNILGVTEGLENKIKKAAAISENLEELIENIKSKRYTEAKITRILLAMMLNITKEDQKISKKTKPYLRVLALSENGKTLISKIANTNRHADIIISPANYIKNSKDKNKKLMLQKDIFATDIYCLAFDNSPIGLDFTTNIMEF